MGIEFGPRSKDRYGRLLYYVYTQDGDSIDEILVSEGLAKAWTVGRAASGFAGGAGERNALPAKLWTPPPLEPTELAALSPTVTLVRVSVPLLCKPPP